jgi:hypothetical protein
LDDGFEPGLFARPPAVDKLIAQQALCWSEIRRLMSVPGVNLICAASFIAAVGSADRFLTSRKLDAYLGLDPRVKQSGEERARSGRISKRGSVGARWAVVESAWRVVLQPGPLHATSALACENMLWLLPDGSSTAGRGERQRLPGPMRHVRRRRSSRSSVIHTARGLIRRAAGRRFTSRRLTCAATCWRRR